MFSRLYGLRSGLPEAFGRRLSGVLLPKNEYKKDTLQKYRVSYCFNLFSLCYKAVVREQKILYFRSKLGLSYNIYIILVGHVGKKSHLSCSLDCYGKLSLVKSTGTGYASGKDLSSL